MSISVYLTATKKFLAGRVKEMEDQNRFLSLKKMIPELRKPQYTPEFIAGLIGLSKTKSFNVDPNAKKKMLEGLGKLADYVGELNEPDYQTKLLEAIRIVKESHDR